MPNSGAVQPLGFVAVADGCLSAVVTHLEMTARPARRDVQALDDWSLRRETDPSVAWYRRLYRDVGQEWLWFSRLELDDAALEAVIRHPGVEIHEAICGGERAGMLELDRRQPGEVELAFFGLTSPYIGRGGGRWLMGRALNLAWRPDVERVWVHTCTFDHPGALEFYVRSGFVPYHRDIETVRDPRLRGVLPPDCAPQHPIIGRSVQ